VVSHRKRGLLARIWDISTGREIASQYAHGDWVRSIAFSPDGRLLATGSADGTAKIWEASTGKERLQIAHPNSVLSVTFSPDGRLLATGSYERQGPVGGAPRPRMTTV
jgi:WD40 repeat protein